MMTIKKSDLPLLSAALFSLLSFSCLVLALTFFPEKDSRVLGVISPITPSTGLVPCSVISSWQSQYCSSTGTTTPNFPTATPTRTLPTPILKTTGLSLKTSCGSNNTTLNFTVFGYLSTSATSLNGVHYLVRDNTTSNVFHQGWSSASQPPYYVSVSATGYLVNSNVGSSAQPTSPNSTYTIHFVNGAYDTNVTWDSPTLAIYEIPKTACSSGATPTLAPTIKSVKLTPVNSFNPSSTGLINYYVTSATSEYSDIKIPYMNFTGLKPSTQYQLFSCDPTSNCSSHTNAVFTTDTIGGYKSTTTITIGSVKSSQLARDFRLYQPLSSGPVPTSSSDTCYMVSGNSLSCLRGYFNL